MFVAVSIYPSTPVFDRQLVTIDKSAPQFTLVESLCRYSHKSKRRELHV